VGALLETLHCFTRGDGDRDNLIGSECKNSRFGEISKAKGEAVEIQYLN